jgi:hypothetical protein
VSAIYLVCAIVLALVVPAKAQQLNQPKTIKLHNNATGEPLGNVTYSNGRAYIRDKDGVHISTVVRNPDGSTTTFDPKGNIIEPVK